MARGGRRSNVDEWLKPENLSLIRYWKRHGLNNKEVAANMGLKSRSALQRWAQQHTDIREALRGGKQQAIAIVENKLYQKAISGNMTAIIFWLKNNARDMYNDSQLSPDELEQVRARTKIMKANARIAEVKAKIAEQLGDSQSEQINKLLDTLVSEVDEDSGVKESTDGKADNGS